MQQENTKANAQAAQALWQKYETDRSLETKNELVLHYMYLVKSIVYRLLPIYKEYTDFDDLLSAGVLGLMDAVEKFSTEREVRFEYYAAMRIKGEIIDSMRKQDWAPSSLRRRIQSISNAYQELESTLSRTPTDKEVADHLGMDEDKMLQAINQSHMFNVLHFEEMITEDYSLKYAVPDKEKTPEEQVETQEIKRILGDMIEDLPEKERLVVTLYYYEELTLKEIAEVLGVSESRVSQIHSKVIMKLKTKMQRLLS
ncbi:FliA/WhiG family RNA polymerase sigma factor [Eubacteriales bacterium OttesenSCG-928-M02]|nr:FliA/WhiG family RNA polymerase sigma factor [Eubacteriales bacterium OttesenSCG-928-M02]